MDNILLLISPALALGALTAAHTVLCVLQSLRGISPKRMRALRRLHIGILASCALLLASSLALGILHVLPREAAIVWALTGAVGAALYAALLPVLGRLAVRGKRPGVRRAKTR